MAYVYTFTSSLDQKVFYVGKGTEGLYGKDRIRSHLTEARGSRLKVSRVAQRMREIWQQGGKVIIRKPYNCLSDRKAYELEEQLIEQHGYEHLLNKEWHVSHQTQWFPPKGRRNGW